MYRVVIVDDEPPIVEGLKRTIDWDSYDCVVAGSAYSGKEGIEIIRSVQPDILFTDIRMPGMGGLAMVAAIRSEMENMQVIISTGYRDFDYAREALTLGVHRYLVKPTRMSELEEAIASATERLKKLEESNDDIPPDNDKANSFVVKQTIAYMQAHYREKLQLADVAEQMYVSYWHLSKLLNATGKSFSETLNEIRIEKAKELMKDSSLHIADVSEKVGFADTAHFSRVFKKLTGMSANEYRNRGLQ